MRRPITFAALILLSQIGTALAFLLLPELANAQSIPTTLGWFEIPNTKLKTVCAAENGFPQVWGVEGCSAITTAWNGGVFDTTRNRLIVWGGGHNAYYGNELYAVSLNNLTIERLTDPGLPPASYSSCVEAIANGTQPNSRHTYDGIEYMPNADRMFVFGGSLACGIGSFGRDTWTFDFKTMKWQRMNPSGPIPQAEAGILTAYDPNTGLLFLHDRVYLYSYNINTDQYTRLSSASSLGYHMAATINPIRKKFVIVGWDSVAQAGRVYTYDIGSGSSYNRQTLSTTGGSTLVSTIYPGLAYDSVSDQIVAWSQSTKDIVYSLNLGTNQWTSVTYAGGPSPAGNGTHGRWSYVPELNLFVLANKVDNNVYTFRLTPPSSSPSGDTTPPAVAMTAPAAGATVSGSTVTVSANATDNVGVVGVRFKLDGTNLGAEDTVAPYSIAWNTTQAVNGSHTLTAVGRDQAGNQTTTPVLTVTVNNQTTPPPPATTADADFTNRCQASGVIICEGFDASTDFVATVWPNSGLYPDGNGVLRGTRDTGIKASGNSSLRFEIPSKSGANVSGYWRQAMGHNFVAGQTFYVQFRQRFSPEMLSVNWESMGTSWKQVIFHGPNATCADVELTTVNYYSGGLPIIYTDCGGRSLFTNNGVPPTLLQQGDYNCPYGNINRTNCFYYPQEQWVTFYYQVSLGNWGQPNSTIKAWVALDGQPYKQWINMPNFTLYNDSVGRNEYSYVTLLPYMTAKNASIAHPTAYTWYDELIVSTQPIPAPGAASSSPPSTPLQPPTNLTILSGQ